VRSSRAPGSGRTSSILAVDSEADLLATYERLLARQGYRVVPVGSREQGLYLIETSPPDLVITEIRLSSASGGRDWC
jgi:DNA-binding NtrC family response regulator